MNFQSDSLTENQKQILIKTFNNLNMVKLRNEINELTNKLYNMITTQKVPKTPLFQK